MFSSSPSLSDSARESLPLVLIVEDSLIQATMLRQLLQKNGYEAMVAANGEQALCQARERVPAIVISDIVMPVMDGYETCCAFKREEKLRHVPVILLTSLTNSTDIVQGLQAGADYYLTKPYDTTYLLSMLQSILGQQTDGLTKDDDAIEIEIEGRSYRIGAGRRQMLNLLLSTYSNAVLQNRLLLQTQHELQTLNSILVGQRAQIEAQQRELRETNALLLHQATRDSLTGLRNFRGFQERLREEIARARRGNEPLSLLLLDVDNFKQFNDSFGHPAGDEVLKRVAASMEAQARTADFVARYGGEEFVILLPETSKDAACLVAERVRAAIENDSWLERSVTASIGVATTPQIMGADGEGRALLAQADIALYHSKRTGRNRVWHVQDIPIPDFL